MIRAMAWLLTGLILLGGVVLVLVLLAAMALQWPVLWVIYLIIFILWVANR